MNGEIKLPPSARRRGAGDHPTHGGRTPSASLPAATARTNQDRRAETLPKEAPGRRPARRRWRSAPAGRPAVLCLAFGGGISRPVRYAPARAAGRAKLHRAHRHRSPQKGRAAQAVTSQQDPVDRLLGAGDRAQSDSPVIWPGATRKIRGQPSNGGKPAQRAHPWTSRRLAPAPLSSTMHHDAGLLLVNIADGAQATISRAPRGGLNCAGGIYE